VSGRNGRAVSLGENWAIIGSWQREQRPQPAVRNFGTEAFLSLPRFARLVLPPFPHNYLSGSPITPECEVSFRRKIQINMITITTAIARNTTPPW
jgi:hypothetical protein